MINLIELYDKLNFSRCERPVNQYVSIITILCDVDVIYSKTKEIGVVRFIKRAALHDCEGDDDRPEIMLSEIINAISVIFNVLKEIIQNKEIATEKETYKIDDINYHKNKDIKNKMTVDLGCVGTPVILGYI